MTATYPHNSFYRNYIEEQFKEYRLHPAVLPGAHERLIAVAEAALASEDSLYMSDWHTCDSTHCIAGWAVHLAGKPGRKLEAKYGSSIAGYMLLGPEAASHFYDTQEQGKDYLESVLAEHRTWEAAEAAAAQADYEHQMLSSAERNPSLCRH